MDFCFMLLYKYFFFVRLHFKKKKKKNSRFTWTSKIWKLHLKLVRLKHKKQLFASLCNCAYLWQVLWNLWNIFGRVFMLFILKYHSNIRISIRSSCRIDWLSVAILTRLAQRERTHHNINSSRKLPVSVG